MGLKFLAWIPACVFIGGACVCTLWAGEQESARTAPQPFDSLEVTLKIQWREVEPLPVIMNGGMIGRAGRHIIYATAFGRRGPKEILTNGYTNAAWAYNMARNRWSRIVDFPGAARAYGTASGVSDEKYAYVFGGQSYTPPYVYDDVYRIRITDSQWRWEKLPNMLWPTAELGACILDGKLYVQGGAIWGTREKDDLSTGFWCTQTNRVGLKFQVLDLSNLNAGWRDLPAMPGVHRTHHTLSAAGGKLYVFGGIAVTAQEKDPKRRGYFNTVDNYCYDPSRSEWIRIRDMPLPLGGHAALTYRNRFILLLGGYSGRRIMDVGGQIREPYGPCEGFEDRVIVYDAKTNKFSLGAPMPFKINDPRVEWINNESFFEATGEIPRSRRIPDCQIGTIRSAPE